LERPEQGLVISENNDWVLVKHIPVDYVIDGFRLYKKAFIEKRMRSDKEIQIEKVLNLKKVSTEAPKEFIFTDTIGFLRWVEEKYGIFEFQDYDDTELTYGKVNKVDNNMLIIDMIKSDGTVEVEYDYEYDLNEIRAITFETDYHISIQLLWKSNL